MAKDPHTKAHVPDAQPLASSSSLLTSSHNIINSKLLLSSSLEQNNDANLKGSKSKEQAKAKSGKIKLKKANTDNAKSDSSAIDTQESSLFTQELLLEIKPEADAVAATTKSKDKAKSGKTQLKKANTDNAKSDSSAIDIQESSLFTQELLLEIKPEPEADVVATTKSKAKAKSGKIKLKKANTDNAKSDSSAIDTQESSVFNKSMLLDNTLIDSSAASSSNNHSEASDLNNSDDFAYAQAGTMSSLFGDSLALAKDRKSSTKNSKSKSKALSSTSEEQGSLFIDGYIVGQGGLFDELDTASESSLPRHPDNFSEYSDVLAPSENLSESSIEDDYDPYAPLEPAFKFFDQIAAPKKDDTSIANQISDKTGAIREDETMVKEIDNKSKPKRTRSTNKDKSQTTKAKAKKVVYEPYVYPIDPKIHVVCGMDEVGRGPLMGDVVAACVVLDHENMIPGLNDSKKLTEKARDALVPLIKEQAVAWGIGRASPQEIDELNILNATFLAMRRAFDAMHKRCNLGLVDGNKIPKTFADVPMVMETVVKGDARVPEISAASILAKTARDADLYELDKLYPEYGFAHHKGYPTKEHLEALSQLPILPCYRLSFGPVKKLLATRENVDPNIVARMNDLSEQQKAKLQAQEHEFTLISIEDFD